MNNRVLPSLSSKKNPFSSISDFCDISGKNPLILIKTIMDNYNDNYFDNDDMFNYPDNDDIFKNDNKGCFYILLIAGFCGALFTIYIALL